jgi:hypothetical protein
MSSGESTPDVSMLHDGDSVVLRVTTSFLAKDCVILETHLNRFIQRHIPLSLNIVYYRNQNGNIDISVRDVKGAANVCKVEFILQKIVDMPYYTQ